jgi:uncharacterized membrane protein YphA (DoxX/SURF4 family)
MKLAATIARFLLGLMFTVFGANGFLHFIPQPPPANPLALQYMIVLGSSHQFVLVFLIQLIAGLLLLSGFFVPLALVLLAPVIVNIVMYHLTLDPGGLPPGALAAILWLVVFFNVRGAFAPLFAAKAPASAA